MRFKFNIFIAVILMILPFMVKSQVMTVNGNTRIYLTPGSIMSVYGGLNLTSSAFIEHDNTSVSNLYLNGKFYHYGTYTQNNYGILRFAGSTDDTIVGNDLDVARLWILKSGSGMTWLNYGTNMIIRQQLRLVSNNLLNIYRSTLTIDSTAMIYPDSTSSYTNDPLSDPFSGSKHITTSGDSALTGKLTRRIKWTDEITTDLNLRFPIGTVNDTTTRTARYYEPVRYVFNSGETTIGKGAYITAQVIAAEHYGTEVKQVALKKYWRIDYDSIKAKVGGYNIRFYYNQNDVQGFEEYYMLCLFYRPKDLTYYINQGSGYGIEPINNRFYVDEVNKKDTLGNTRLLLDGEWTAGQAEAISTFYYSRANGDWSSSSTWSKESYNGAASTTIPNNLNDKVFIGNGKTVTLSSSSAEINKTTIDTNGRLKITNVNAKLEGDSLYVKDGGTLAVCSPDGIQPLGSSLGNITTTKIRSYSSKGKYEFIGNQDQVTGPGIPDIVGSIIISKDAVGNTVSLSKSILIKDSLVINEGTYNLFKNGNFSSNGETGDTTNRSIIMRGGDIIVQSYPTNYKNGFFTAGAVSFAGTSSFRFPSSASPSPGEPSVTQYFNVHFEGARGPNTVVTLDPTGEIRIGGLLDISALSFNATPLSDRFLVTGSTVVFNGSGDQQIQTGYPTQVGINYRLKFHNLVIDGGGNKSIMNPNDLVTTDDHVLVRSLVHIKNGTLNNPNNYWIKCLGNWTAETGSTFNAGTGLVSFEADGKVTNITSKGTSFHDVRIMGTLANGYVNYIDDMNIAGNLEINPNSFRCLNSASLSIQGNWLNNGVFVANTGRVIFNGTSTLTDQQLMHNGTGDFYQLTVNKSAGMVKINGDSLIKITNDLTLTKGNIGGSRTFNAATDSVQNKPLIVDGTITRPAGTPGHVDGRLRLPTVEGTNSITFQIGLGSDYAPMKMDINGPGGRGGYLDGYVLLDTTAPSMGRVRMDTQMPNGAEMDTTKNIRKAWVLNADSTLSMSLRFLLATSRTFDLEFFFPVADKRNGANSDNFLISQRDTTLADDLLNAGRWSLPFVSNTNSLSTKTTGNTSLKNSSTYFFLVGEPKIFTYYSIADGNFNSLNTWSIFGYQSIEVPTRLPGTNDNIRIGNGKTVNMNISHTIGSAAYAGSSSRIFRVETGGTGYQNGHLKFVNDVYGQDTVKIWGIGTFRLDSGAAITIMHSEGISTGALGCIRTATRNYNFNTHNKGNFIYARRGNQATGDGLPLYINTLKVDLAVVKADTTRALTFTNANTILHVSDSIYIFGGNAVFSNINTKLGGNFIADSLGRFDFGTAALAGASDAYPNTGLRDSTTRLGGLMFDGTGNQYIWAKRANPKYIIGINRLSLVKPSGKVIAFNNINAGQLFFHEANRANYNCLDSNKWVWGRVNVLRLGGFTGADNTDPGWTQLHDPKYGYVEGRLLRSILDNQRRQFPIGSLVKYAPMDIYINNQATPGNGLIEVQAIEGNHPDFKTTQINQNTNIQRYYEISLPVDTLSTLVIGNSATLAFRARIIFTADEPRGGINPLNYDAFRLRSTLDWTNTTNILTDSNTSTHLMFNLNTDPKQINNNIFEVTSKFSTAKSITLMVGEPAVSGDRIFYSKNSGNWTSTSTWTNESANILYANTETGYALTGNDANTYPQSSTTFRDYVIIGDGDSVNFDIANVDLQYVLVEKSVNGVGKLRIPGTNYFRTDQFVQKNGGEIFIGSPNGIVSNSTTSGSIRQLTANAIINFDWNQLGVNQFAYIGETTPQATGTGLPNRVSSLEINTTAASGVVNLTNDAVLTVLDSLVFLNGTFKNAGTINNLSVKGDIVNHNNSAGFNSGSTRSVILDSTRNQKIRGNADSTVFYSTLTINKTSDSVSIVKNVRINSILDMQSNTFLNVWDNRTLTFGDAATINNIATFNANKMIKVSGGANTGKLRKTYTVGAVNPSFTFPVGEDSTSLRAARYGEAKFDLNSMTFAAGNFLEFSLRSNYPHPSLTGSPNMLKKYWSVYSEGITAGTMSTRLRYNDAEVVGNILSYVPVLYRRATLPTSSDPGWSATLFNPTSSSVDTTNKYIIVNASNTLPYHDWTAGDPSAFATGKNYWSRKTGNWRDGNTWTNVTSSGIHNIGNEAALNYPGYYANDKVFIGDTHIVSFDNSLNYPIDSVGIGITLPTTSPELTFATSAASNKSLRIVGSLMIGATGKLSKVAGTGASYDSIYIKRDFSNIGGTGRGVAIYPSATQNVKLIFNGSDSTRILGEGVYTSIGNLALSKTDSSWNFVNKSASFSTAFSNSLIANSINLDLNAGMYIHDINSNITLSKNGSGNVFLGDRVGLVVRNGNVLFSDGLICGQNASVWLTGGTLTIGNAIDENFQYESITIIDIAGASQLKVAGAMRRRFATSNVDFRLKNTAQIEVMLYGATTISSERRAAFDFGEANSLFKMTDNSKVIIYRPMGLSGASEKDPDYLVSASTYTVTGGTVQIGDPATPYTGGQQFSLIASVPFWNLDIANTYGKDLIVGSPIVTIRNDFLIRDLGRFNQNGNNLNIGGDFTIDGYYKTGTTGTRRVSFFGDTLATPATKKTQTLSIKNIFSNITNSNDNFFDFVVNKPDSGTVVLNNSASYPYSNIILSNTLEFSVGNRGLISTGNDRYVQVGTNDADLASIQRFGNGHVNGFLRRWFGSGTQDRLFTVGTNQYTPVEMLTSSGTGTSGLFSVKAYDIAHPDISRADTILQANTQIDRYWQVLPVGSTALGTRTFTLTLFFVKGSVPTGDVKSGSTFGIFEHFRRTAQYPSAGEWYTTIPYQRSDSSTTTNLNTAFGDFIIGEIAGLRFFSARSGDWNVKETWRINSYEGLVATRTPTQETDRVFIGNGHTITIQNSSPKVRATTVEIYNTFPGKLIILDERYLRGLSFTLNPNCFVATDDAFGFTDVNGSTPNIGAIRTTSTRSYGKGTYEFIGTQAQAIGDGPVLPKTIVVNNSGATNNSVSFSPFTYTVQDTILVQDGRLLMGSGLVNLKGDFVVNSGTNVVPDYGTLNLNNTIDQNLVMNDTSGIELYNLRLTKTGGTAFLHGTDSASRLKIIRNLDFATGNTSVLNGRLNNKLTVLTSDTSTITRTGSGHVDGYLLRQMPAGSVSNFKYEIGFGSLYLPATLNISSGSGTSGLVAGFVNSPPSINISRINPTKRINYYWGVSPWTNFSLGTRTATTKFQFPASQLSNLTLVGGEPTSTFIFRKSIPTESALWTQKSYAQTIWNTSTATVENKLTDSWSGLGEFFISEKYFPTYYSRQSGNWNDNKTWTMNSTHIGDTLEVGDYPNADALEKGDSVYVGLTHIVTLNIAEPQIGKLVVRNNSKLDMGINSINCPDCSSPVKGLFDLRDNATIAFGGTANPSSTANMKNFANYIMSSTSTVEFTGTQTITPTPFAPSLLFTSYPGNVRISGIGVKTVSEAVLINGNLYIDTGSSLIISNGVDALSVRGSVINQANIINNGIIEIGICP